MTLIRTENMDETPIGYYVVLFLVALVGMILGIFAYMKRSKNTIFGDSPGIHLVLAFLAPWVSCVTGSVELARKVDE